MRLGEVETIEYHRDKGLGVTVYFDRCKGSASSTDFTSRAVYETVHAACDIAHFTAMDEYAGLAEIADLAQHIPDLDLYHPWNINADQGITLALQCEAAARDRDSRITNSEGATLSTLDGFHLYANSNRFMHGYPSSRHTLSCAVITQQDTSMQRDYW